MKNRKLTSILATLGAGLALFSTSALSGITYYDPVTNFEDDNLDWLEDNTGSPSTLDIGDRLISVLIINQTVNFDQTASAPITDGELTGIVVVEVVNKVDLGFNDPITGLPQFFFTFGAPSNGLDVYLPQDLPGTIGDAGDGAAVAGYWDAGPGTALDSPPQCPDMNTCLAWAGDGELWEADTFDDLGAPLAAAWGATGADDISGMATAPAVTKVAILNYRLNIELVGAGLENVIDLSAGPAQMIGSADILGGEGLTNGAFARSDADFQKRSSIPEPGTLALLSAGILGLGVAKRRRRKL